MPLFNKKPFQLLLLVCLLAFSHTAYAAKAIEVSLSGGTNSRSFTNIEDAIDSLLADPSTTYGGAFGIGNNFTGTLSIFGFDVNLTFSGADIYLDFLGADGSTVTLSIIGNTFRADSLTDLDQFFQSEQAKGTYKQMMEGLQVHAKFNFISGPESTVGQSVRDNTMRAMGPSQTLAERRLAARGAGGFSIGAEYSEFDIGGYSGTTYTVPIEFSSGLGKWGHFLFRLPLGYSDVEGTEFYRFGTELDLAITIAGHGPTSPFKWQITPTVGNYFMGTADLYIGGDVYNYGVQNQLSARFGQFSGSYGVYYGKYESAEISLSDVVVDLGVDATVISHGVKVIYSLGSNALLDIYAINSRPDDGIGYYEIETVGGNISFRGGSTVLRIGYAEDQGMDTANESYESKRVTATLIFTF